MAMVTEVVGQQAALLADNNATITRRFKVAGVASDAAATIAVRDYLLIVLGSPPNLGALALDKISASEEVPGVYDATAAWRTFARTAPRAMGESQFSFELSLEPVRIRVPRGAIQVYAAPGEPTWTPQLIGDTGNGEEPEGVDVYEPTYEESETHWVPLTALTPAYREVLKTCVGSVNNAPFKGNAAGEALLKGVSGTRRGAADAEVTFRWGVRRNQSGMTIQGVTGVNKGGWQYLWPRSKIVPQGSNVIRHAITHVAVATVFPAANFTDLNIGT